ncbi:MAG TPA: UbiA family prenyltransferase [Phycisphaerales bacterium]|nr:UbiA family prenyltransferase [Phycisphaerales bacterium]
MRLITAIQLTRLTMAFGAVSDVWFVILLTRGLGGFDHLPVAQMDLIPALLAGAALAIGLFAYGASLNDVLDARHDSAFSPERPIPAGRIRPAQAVVVTVGALIVAMLAAESFGKPALWIGMLTAAALLFYNATGKFIPAVGLVTIGLIHAAHMLLPNYQLGFTWPVWLVMTHSLAGAIAVHVLEDKRPRLTRNAFIGVIAGWVFWSALLLGVGVYREGWWPDHITPRAVIYPAITVVLFCAVAYWKTRRITGRVAAEKLKRYGAMWQCLYGAAWLLALGLTTQAMWIGAFAVCGFLGMTLIKEISGVSGKPMTYRL